MYLCIFRKKQAMNQENIKKLRRFRRWGIVTVVATIFLIWVGGWVRSTGSGMGCPDWPKCFDVWVPPTSEAQLPPDYLEHYVEARKKKNGRVAKTLSRMGFKELATKIENDPSVFTHEPFNFYKTWTEYINRVIGVLVGFFIFLTVIFGWQTRKTDNRLFRLSLAGFIGVGFEGWLGSLVVSTNLMPSFITVHMIIAMLILLVLIAAVIIAYTREGRVSDLVYVKPMGKVWLGIGVSALVLAQIIMGTQVRESIDVISKTMGEAQRHLWVENLPSVYTVHRFFYYIVTAAIMYWIWQLKQEKVYKVASVRLFSMTLLGVLISEIALGISMHHFGIPPILQPLHLLFGTLLFAASFTVTALIYYIKPR
jgi:heme a synthase